MSDILTLNNNVENDFIISDTKVFDFDSFFVSNLPEFFRENFIGLDNNRINTLYNHSEDILNDLYTYVSDFLSDLNLKEASPKFIYLLGQLLGLSELVDLTGSTDFGSIERQREYVKSSLDRFLIKGTSESIVRLYWGLGFNLKVQELWTTDGINFVTEPAKFISNFNFREYYDGKFTYSGVSTEIYNVISLSGTSLSADLGYNPGIVNFKEYNINDFGYSYLLANTLSGSELFFKANSWFKYTDSSQVNTAEIFSDKIYIRQNTNSFKIYRYNDLNNILYSLSGVNFFDIIQLNDKYYGIVDHFDTYRYLKIMDLDNYNFISSVNILSGFSTITDTVKINDNEWFIVDVPNRTYFSINISNSLNLTLPLSGMLNTYSIPRAGALSASYIIPGQTSDSILVLDVINNQLIKSSATINNHIMSFRGGEKAPLTITYKDSFVIDSTNIFVLGLSGYEVYFPYGNTVNFTANFMNSDLYTCERILQSETLNEIYIQRRNNITSELSILIFKGVLTFGSYYHKSHFFNLINTDINNIVSDSLIRPLINTIKPIHTELLKVINEFTFDEIISSNSALSGVV